MRVTCVEPGYVETELQAHNSTRSCVERSRSCASPRKVLESADIANAIVYAPPQPRHASVNEILVRPSGQNALSRAAI